MVVEHAERFGLSQLHQLRGRVGRGPHASYCVLIYQEPLSDEARARLEAIAATTRRLRDRRAGPAAAGRGRRRRDAAGGHAGAAGRPICSGTRDLMDEAAARGARLDRLDVGGGGAAAAFVRERWGRQFGLVDVG